MGHAVHNFVPEGAETAEDTRSRSRWHFTIADFEAMVAAGIIPEDEHVELIGGELRPMSPKGNHHELLKQALNIHWAQRLPKAIMFATEPGLRLAPDHYVEPDFLFHDKGAKLTELKGKDAQLVVELANSSYRYDIGEKAKLYARFGVRELWVIHAVKLETHIHRQPTLDGFGDVKKFRKNQQLQPAFAPELAVTLADLDL